MLVSGHDSYCIIGKKKQEHSTGFKTIIFKPVMIVIPDG